MFMYIEWKIVPFAYNSDICLHLLTMPLDPDAGSRGATGAEQG